MMQDIDRRHFLANAVIAIGVAGAAFPGWSSLEAAARGKPPYLDPARLAVLDAVAETIIPRTDTPGARDAGVPRRFDLLMRSWASAQTRADFTRVLGEIDAAAKGMAALPAAKGMAALPAAKGMAALPAAKGIAALPAAGQLEVVAAYDAANMRNPAYAKFKGLVLSLYYLSEQGALQELRYEHTPGAWEPSIPVTADTRGWAIDVAFG